MHRAGFRFEQWKNKYKKHSGITLSTTGVALYNTKIWLRLLSRTQLRHVRYYCSVTVFRVMMHHHECAVTAHEKPQVSCRSRPGNKAISRVQSCALIRSTVHYWPLSASGGDRDNSMCPRESRKKYSENRSRAPSVLVLSDARRVCYTLPAPPPTPLIGPKMPLLTSLSRTSGHVWLCSVTVLRRTT